MQLRKLSVWVAFGMLLASAGVLGADAPKPEVPKVGSPFPALDGFSLEGKLPDTKGKVVIVDFWASWCGPCKQSMPAFKELHEKFADRGLVIIAVSLDETKEAMDGYLKKSPMPFSIARDAAEKLQKRLDISGIPLTYILDRQGVIRVIHEGYDGDDSKREYRAKVEELLK
ncbi:MAG TPA: TlpA disulfide reductase family protein [Candidatus Limnocylindria bacterium]|nr:TlpA disulfide reductase family protein [Candidatus Limnocylindria bacterium]